MKIFVEIESQTDGYWRAVAFTEGADSGSWAHGNACANPADALENLAQNLRQMAAAEIGGMLARRAKPTVTTFGDKA